MKSIFMVIFLIGINSPMKTQNVFICVSGTASKYHLSATCKGLNECTHQIKKVTLNEANKRGYKSLCGWEK